MKLTNAYRDELLDVEQLSQEYDPNTEDGKERI